MSEIEKKWYVLRAVSGKESKVKEYLDADIKNSDLSEYVIATEFFYATAGIDITQISIDQNLKHHARVGSSVSPIAVLSAKDVSSMSLPVRPNFWILRRKVLPVSVSRSFRAR